MSQFGRDLARRAVHRDNRRALAEQGITSYLTIGSDGRVALVGSHKPHPGRLGFMGYLQGEHLSRVIATSGASFVVRFKAYKPEFLDRLEESTRELDRLWP